MILILSIVHSGTSWVLWLGATNRSIIKEGSVGWVTTNRIEPTDQGVSLYTWVYGNGPSYHQLAYGIVHDARVRALRLYLDEKRYLEGPVQGEGFIFMWDLRRREDVWPILRIVGLDADGKVVFDRPHGR